MTLKISSDNIQSSGVSAGSYPNANVTVNTSGIITSIASGIVAGAGTFFTYTYTGDGTTTTFSGGSNMTVHNVIVAENGVVQYPTTDYTVSSTNIVFTSAPASGVLIQIRILAGGTLTPKITNITVTDSNYNNLDDTAVNTSGGYIKITGTDFFTGCQVVVGAVVATSVTFISNTEVRAQVPAQSAGTYTVYLTNSDGGVAIRVNGLNYSATPTWTTTSPLPSGFKNSPISLQLSATSNSSVTYSLQSGSTLPSGLTLSSSGLLSGTVTSISAETTYNFTVIATDGEAQDTPQAFQITIIISDLYYPLVTLHLPGNGTNLANNNTFLDGSTNNFTITRNGNTTQGTFSPFSQTGWGNYFDGTGDYLTANGGTTANLGTTWTIECWLYPNNVSGTGAIVNVNINTANQGINIYRSGATITVDNGGSAGTGPSGGTLVANTWQHVAVVADGTNTRIYLNGSQVGSTFAGTVTLGTPTHFWIGSSFTGLTAWAGYISNARIVKGVAVYTGAFTPPTSPLAATQSAGTNISAITGTQTSLLTCQSNRFIDNSTNNFTITPNGNTSVVAFSPFLPTSAWSASTVGGSGYFDGTGDYLTTATATAFQLGSNNFTIETWVYQTTTATFAGLIACRTGATFDGVNIYSQTNGTQVAVLFASSSGAWGASITSSTLTNSLINRWAHVALVRNGTTATLYVDGVSVGSTTVNFSIYQSANRFFVGIDGNGAFTGFLSSSRIVKGTAVYTGNFTPPTAPLTAITNTSLLLNFTNSGIYDATAKNVLETVGDAQVSTAISAKWGSGSMYFDGTGDWLQLPASDIYAFGSGDYTVEAWVYLTSVNNTTLQIIFMSGSTGGNSFYFHVDGNQISVGTTAAFISNQVATFTTNLWYHIAACRSGTTLRLFVNGTQAGSNATDTTNWTSSGNARIGANEIGGQTVFGYIQDLRITKGYARYTANFTPPTAAFAQQ